MSTAQFLKSFIRKMLSIKQQQYFKINRHNKVKIMHKNEIPKWVRKMKIFFEIGGDVTKGKK